MAGRTWFAAIRSLAVNERVSVPAFQDAVLKACSVTTVGLNEPRPSPKDGSTIDTTVPEEKAASDSKDKLISDPTPTCAGANAREDAVNAASAPPIERRQRSGSAIDANLSRTVPTAHSQRELQEMHLCSLDLRPPMLPLLAVIESLDPRPASIVSRVTAIETVPRRVIAWKFRALGTAESSYERANHSCGFDESRLKGRARVSFHPLLSPSNFSWSKCKAIFTFHFKTMYFDHESYFLKS